MQDTRISVQNIKAHDGLSHFAAAHGSVGWVLKLSVMFLLLAISFMAEISSVKADGLFDFQMTLAKKGNAEAEYKVGEMYETGFGVKKNIHEAEIWTKKAASQGHETAGFKLLYWDLEKNGLKGDNKNKYDELLGKAKSENGQAMFYIGKMYAYGVGVKKNHDKALDWLNKATFIGIVEAEREAISVREMKQKSLAQARKEEERRKAVERKDAQDKAKAKAKAKAKKEEDKKRLKAEKDRLYEERKKKVSEIKQKQNDERIAKERAAAMAKEQEQAKSEEERIQAEKSNLLAKQNAAKKEQKRQELLKKANESNKNEEFESDPCGGKSARFLSTCR